MTTSEALTSYINGLDPNAKKSFCRRIRRECNISRQILYNWMKGRTEIKVLSRAKITEIIGKDIFADIAICENWHE